MKLLTIVLLIYLSAAAGCSPVAVIETTSTPIPEPTATSLNTPEPTAEPTAAWTPTKEPSPKALAINIDSFNQLQVAGRASQIFPNRIVWSLDGNTFSVAGENQIIVYDAVSLVSVSAVAIQETEMLLDISPDGKTFAATTDQETIELKDLYSGDIKNTITPQYTFFSAVFSPDGQTLAVPSMDDIAASLWDITDGNKKKTLVGFRTAAPVYDIAFTPDSSSLVWISRAKIQIMDIESETLSPSFEHEGFIQAFALSGDNKILATATGGTINGEFKPLIQLWDTSSGEDLGVLATNEILRALTFSPDGRLLVAGDGKHIAAWNVKERQKVAELQEHRDTITALAFSPDGQDLVTASNDNSIILWQIIQ